MGIPSVHIATITPISQNVGANRIIPGVSIPHPTGEILSSYEDEKAARLKQITSALNALATDVDKSTIFTE